MSQDHAVGWDYDRSHATVGGEWLKALLLPSYDAQFLHQAKRAVTTAVKRLFLKMVVDRTMAIAATGLLVQLSYTLFDVSIFDTPCTRPPAQQS